MKEIIVNAELLDNFSRPKKLRNKRYVYSHYRLEDPQVYCKGCDKKLEINEKVYQFRPNTYVHVEITCIKALSKYIITKELKQLL